jgi:hypothetical protein
MEFCPQFLNFSSGVEKFGTGDMNKTFCVMVGFAKNGAVRTVF